VVSSSERWPCQEEAVVKLLLRIQA